MDTKAGRGNQHFGLLVLDKQLPTRGSKRVATYSWWAFAKARAGCSVVIHGVLTNGPWRLRSSKTKRRKKAGHVLSICFCADNHPATSLEFHERIEEPESISSHEAEWGRPSLSMHDCFFPQKSWSEKAVRGPR